MMNQQENQQFLEAQRRHHKGEIASALRVYEVLLKKNKSNKSAQVFRLLALAQLGKGLSHVHEANLLLGELDNLGLPDLIALSIFYKSLGLLKEQLEALNTAEQKFPNSIPVMANLGNYYLHTGNIEKSWEIFTSIVERSNDDPGVHLNLARICIVKGDFDEAESHLNKAESISPNFPDINFLKAVISNHDCDYESTLSYLEEVLKVQVIHRDAWKILRNLPVGLLKEEFFDDSVKLIIKNKVSDPSILLSAYSISRNSLYWNNISILEEQIDNSMDRNTNFAADPPTVFTSLQTNLSPEKLRNVAQQSWKNSLIGTFKLPKFDFQNRTTKTKLKVGYLSSDFRDHVVSRIVFWALERHNKHKFEIYAYSNFGGDGSEIRERLSGCIDQWVNISNLNDNDLANKIYADEIDVLVDLNGITKGTRVRVFQHRPAPVQITWLGMPGTLGAADSCDYIIVDQNVINDINRCGFDEKFIFLPSTYVPVGKATEPPVGITRSHFGIPDNCFNFASFCTPQKYHPKMIGVWAEILIKAESSCLLLLDHGENINAAVVKSFERLNVPKERLVFLPSLPHLSHLQRLTFVDCALETWPYGAGGTCVDLVRAGAPIVCLQGDQFYARVGSSIALASGLGDLVANDFDQYVLKALNVYNMVHVQNNAQFYKSKIRESGVFDLDLFVSNLESAFIAAHQNFLHKKIAEDIFIN